MVPLPNSSLRSFTTPIAYLVKSPSSRKSTRSSVTHDPSVQVKTTPHPLRTEGGRGSS